MTKFEYITNVVERKFQYRGGIEMMLPYEIDYDWWFSIDKRTSFVFQNFRSKGAELFNTLSLAIQHKDKEAVHKILPEMEKYCIKRHDAKPEVEKWGDMAIQLPGDWGPVGNKKLELKEIITKRSRGKILEAMCGFNSYFEESEKIKEIIVLDFCREALERFEYPKRTRILYDLEKVVNGEKMDFFDNGEFQTIGIFFGIDYLTNPILVHREFYRILSNDGRLLIVGGTTQGYKDMLKRKFDPKDCSDAMESAGFSTKIEYLPLKTDIDLGEYYLVEGTK